MQRFVTFASLSLSKVTLLKGERRLLEVQSYLFAEVKEKFNLCHHKFNLLCSTFLLTSSSVSLYETPDHRFPLVLIPVESLV